MNIVKKTYLIIAFFAINLGIVNTYAYEYEGLTFGETNGKFCRFGASGTKTKEAEQQVFAHLDKCASEHRNPFLWDVGAPAGMITVWRVSGDLDKIYTLMNKAQKSGATVPNWIWSKVSSPSIIINLTSTGFGWVDLIEKGNLVGRLSCQSSERAKQPHAGMWEIKGKCVEDGKPGRTSRKHNKWMAWAMEIKNSNPGIYLHSGSFLNNSDGCVRLPEPGAESLRQLLAVGSRVEIVYK